MAGVGIAKGGYMEGRMQAQETDVRGLVNEVCGMAISLDFIANPPAKGEVCEIWKEEVLTEVTEVRSVLSSLNRDQSIAVVEGIVGAINNRIKREWGMSHLEREGFLLRLLGGLEGILPFQVNWRIERGWWLDSGGFSKEGQKHHLRVVSSLIESVGEL